MYSQLKITVCGGDKRYLKAFEMFHSNGFDASYTICEKLKGIAESDVVVFPIASFDREGNLLGTEYTIYELLYMLKSKTIIFAGKVPTIIKKILEEHKIEIYDYTDNEEFNILNAVSTAEGAILTLLKKSTKTIAGSNCIVLGYGRIGRALAIRLKALGANVTVGARSTIARANAFCDGINAMEIPQSIEKASNADVIFNTIPSPIITEENIEKISNSLIIDLASIPGGLSEKAKQVSGENFIHALSLPGKHFPDTAGEAIYKTIINVMREKGLVL